VPDDELTTEDAINLAQQSIIAPTLNLHTLRPNETLAAYGFIYKFKTKFKP
jgi:hypothetical protein